MSFHYLLEQYGLPKDTYTIQPTGSGLINNTYLIEENAGGKKYIFQKINTEVFKKPKDIADNIRQLDVFLKKTFPDYLFIASLPAKNEDYVFYNQEGAAFRLFPFIEKSVCYQIAQAPNLAFSAANAFGQFTFLLKDFPAESLHITLPDFHNLILRYYQYEKALAEGNKEKIINTREIARQLKKFSSIEKTYREICNSPQFKKRVTHHDTKISNVLFNEGGNTLCIIDLDTVMPGYFMSDVGDMMRNYLSAANEEESDFSAISIRMDYFEAIAKGYLGQMCNTLTTEEKAHFVYSGKMLTFMQALRFYTDYLMDDIYYPIKYFEHNLVRTQNQLVLLEKILEGESEMEGIVRDILQSLK